MAVIVLAALACAATWALLFRSDRVDDRLAWQYARRDGAGAAKDYIALWSTHRYVWFNVSKSLARPVEGYFDFDEVTRAGGRPHVTFTHFANAGEYFLVDPFEGMMSWGPVFVGNWRNDRPGVAFTAHTIRIAAPHWVLGAALALLPAWSIARAAVRWRRRRGRIRRGECLACGYDVRASGERCPECGRPLDPARPSLPREASPLQSPIA